MQTLKTHTAVVPHAGPAGVLLDGDWVPGSCSVLTPAVTDEDVEAAAQGMRMELVGALAPHAWPAPLPGADGSA
jgi:hypothetical protein